ncbi:SDR family oxidoreductase [Aggregatilinea lenta]|uniref:SDR family oxidoreductase n=1 Tax=Aggregatilinea lenta TaxID=913108 RepID=UPI000E5B3BAE|nr:sugar nucleotide-binding protein [Aggregatilinea lenta]
MARLLITGASGTLGGPLSLLARQAGWDLYAGYFSRPDRVRAGRPCPIDLRDAQAVREAVDEIRPDVIVHAAVTERSGPGYDEAIRQAAQNVAQAAKTSGARLIALSTDLVFDGTSAASYTEESPVRPLETHLYGLAKADAEADVLARCPSALIVRTSLIYDFHVQNAQMAWMLRAIERGEPLRLFTDQFRSPVWVWTLAAALLELAELDLSGGVLHVAGPAPVSRYMLGMALLTALGVDPAPHVQAAACPDTQAKRIVLSVDRARDLLRTPLMSLAQARVAAGEIAN